MSKIQIIIDSTAYLTREEARENEIKVVPLFIHFEGEDFQDPFLGEFANYYERLAGSKEFPTTSMPSIGAFVKEYQEAIDQGKEVLVLTFSSKLSGTYNNALIAAEMVDQDKITVIDTFTSVGNFKYMVLQTVKMAKEGKSRQKIADFIEEQKRKMDVYFTVGSLEYLRRGGRLTNASAFIGSILNIKPIIQLKNGELVGVEKTRGKKRAIDILIKKVPNYAKNICVHHILNEKEAFEVAEILREKCPEADILVEEIGPVIGSHLGPYAIGVVYTW